MSSTVMPTATRSPVPSTDLLSRSNDDIRQRRRDFISSEIARHAITLFVEHGFDAVTVDAIATASEISPRTFFRYFPSKLDVLRDHQRFLFSRLSRALAARPPTETPIVALRKAFLSTAEMRADDRARVVEIGRLLLREDLTVARTFAFEGVHIGELCEIFVARGATDNLDLEATVGAMLGAANAAFRFWVRSNGAEGLAEMMLDAFRHVTARRTS